MLPLERHSGHNPARGPTGRASVGLLAGRTSALTGPGPDSWTFLSRQAAPEIRVRVISDDWELINDGSDVGFAN
jgi:hypothetical protein